VIYHYWDTTPELDAWLTARATPGWIFKNRNIRRDAKGRFT